MKIEEQAALKIGDVAERTGVATRLIRYYEQQGLLNPPRRSNGYRSYRQEDVERVSRIAGLVQAGIPTRLVKVLMDAEDANARNEPTCPLEVADQLTQELDAIEQRIACLSRSRDTIRTFLRRTRRGVPARR